MVARDVTAILALVAPSLHLGFRFFFAHRLIVQRSRRRLCNIRRCAFFIIMLMLLQSKHFKGLLVNCRARLYFVNVDYNKKVSSINRFELLDLVPPGA